MHTIRDSRGIPRPRSEGTPPFKAARPPGGRGALSKYGPPVHLRSEIRRLPFEGAEGTLGATNCPTQGALKAPKTP